jgi:hypothetical protein
VVCCSQSRPSPPLLRDRWAGRLPSSARLREGQGRRFSRQHQEYMESLRGLRFSRRVTKPAHVRLIGQAPG